MNILNILNVLLYQIVSILLDHVEDRAVGKCILDFMIHCLEHNFELDNSVDRHIDLRE